MKKKTVLIAMMLCLTVFAADATFAGDGMGKRVSVIFLHHSTGNGVWRGGMADWFDSYNRLNGTNYQIIERYFPSGDPYKWKNYPFDYWNIWVKNAGHEAYMEEPTLETLTQLYDVIVWKHCYPVSNILPDTGNPDVTSEKKRIENYKLQYAALKKKMHEYPDTRFVVWTGAALVEKNTKPENAERARRFFDWVKSEWDEAGDNIFLWDLFELETEGGLYLTEQNARSATNSHPNMDFNVRVAPRASKRIVDVIEGRGDTGDITGK